MRIALLALPFVFAAPLVAQMPTTAPGMPDPARVVAGTYKADPAHTQVNWQVNHMGFSFFDGSFADPTGTITLDPKAPGKATVAIEIPIGGLTTTNAKLTTHMLSKDFFDVAQFPTARFVSTSVALDPKDGDIDIAGNLTLHGVTKSVTLEAKFVGAGTNFMTKKPALGFRAKAKIKRSDFGIGYGIPLVSDEVKLTINAAFDAQ